MDDAELGDGNVGLAGEARRERPHVVGVRLHGPLGELSEGRRRAVLGLGDGEDVADVGLPARPVLEGVRVNAEQVLLRAREELRRNLGSQRLAHAAVRDESHGAGDAGLAERLALGGVVGKRLHERPAHAMRHALHGERVAPVDVVGGLVGVERQLVGRAGIVVVHDDESAGDAAQPLRPLRRSVLGAVRDHDDGRLARRALGERHEVAARDELALARLLVLALEVAAAHELVDLRGERFVAHREAVEAAARRHGGHGLLGPAHDGLDVPQRGRDGDAEVLEDVLSVVVAAAELVLGEVVGPDAEQLVHLVGDAVLVAAQHERRHDRAAVVLQAMRRRRAAMPGVRLLHQYTTALRPGLLFVVLACHSASAQASIKVASAPPASSKPTPSLPMRRRAVRVAEAVSSS